MTIFACPPLTSRPPWVTRGLGIYILCSMFPVMRDDFRLSPSDVPAAVGDTATFHCQPPVGKPDPKVLWRKGQELIQGDSRIQVKDNGDLVINSVMVSDAGKYTCLAKNMAGEKASIPATLKVLGKLTKGGRVLFC